MLFDTVQPKPITVREIRPPLPKRISTETVVSNFPFGRRSKQLTPSPDAVNYFHQVLPLQAAVGKLAVKYLVSNLNGVVYRPSQPDILATNEVVDGEAKQSIDAALESFEIEMRLCTKRCF
ncbi:hypothetical protein [Paraburkholderia bryophila]|uniref:Uncharacterized protein n=1 Tax=Paraburkholderia bryophila TaxID=420952 RepID=A0A7Y9WNL8_9BURK|nr:hypothetical protein [Paraburkholderia bryophila]NYH24234.1 hypothetical protein [Paraburkholderia bryophila]